MSAAVAEPHRAKILLLGLKRSGKTSIRQVLFGQMAAKDTFYLERTTKVVKHAYDTVIPLEIWDCPGATDVATVGAPLNTFASLVFVIDIQSSPEDYLSRLVDFILAAQTDAPDLHLEIFVHKSDTMSDAHYRLETFRQIQQQLAYELAEASPVPAPVIHFALTSVYDSSIHDAFSRTLHKVLPSLPFLEELMNMFCVQSHAQKAFLFDVHTRLYLATDHTPVDSATLAWCIDYLRLLSSFGRLYTSRTETPVRMRALAIPAPELSMPTRPPHPTRIPSSSRLGSPNHTPRTQSSPLPLLSPAPSLPASLPSTSSPSLHPSSVPSSPSTSEFDSTPRPLFASSAHASVSPATAHVHAPTQAPSGGTGSAIAFHAAGETLALVSILPARVWPAKRALVDYNVVFLREGVREIVKEEWAARGGGPKG